MSKSVSGYLSLPAESFLVDVLHINMFNTDSQFKFVALVVKVHIVLSFRNLDYVHTE